tara:strand:+ start:859 stop:1116 length:258 start_codon:yes stop_codon:yes gene_type:complete
MKGKNVNFEKLIISEVQSIAKEIKLNIHLKEGFEITEVSELDLEKDFEEVNTDEFAEESKKAKTLSEEVFRMKELLNFNSPLLKK